MTIVTAAGAVTVQGVVEPAWLEVSGGRIAALGSGEPPRPPDVEFREARLVPGFVDLHVHGGGGASFDAGTHEALRAAAFHRRHGTTTLLASLVTAPLADMARSTRSLAELAEDDTVAGVHLEGPFLSAARCGAHDPALLRAPHPQDLDTLIRAGGGAVRMVTLAPELDGGLEAVRRVATRCGVAAVGHTDADFATTRAAVEAGARVATHLFNAMPPVHHRAPGPVVALLNDARVVVELINDGAHLHPAVVRTATSAAGPRRVALVTDAIAAAGMGDGRYRLGRLDVEVQGGAARLVEGGATAGGTGTMAEVFRRTAQELGVEAAVAMASATPARVLGRDDIGALAPGLRADVVAVDPNHQTVAVMRGGDWVERTTD